VILTFKWFLYLAIFFGQMVAVAFSNTDMHRIFIVVTALFFYASIYVLIPEE
jgi:hypothetical protein